MHAFSYPPPPPPGALSKDNIIYDVICENSNHERNNAYDFNPSPIPSPKGKNADMLYRTLTPPDLPKVGWEEKWENHNLSVNNYSYETYAESNFTLNKGGGGEGADLNSSRKHRSKR